MPKSLPGWTWVLPFFIFHLGTQLSLTGQIAPATSLWYLPIPLALVLVHWWGLRILPGLYLNAVLSAPLWGLPFSLLTPLYGLPDVVIVALSYAFFNFRKDADPRLPDVKQALRFSLLGVALPIFIGVFFLHALLIGIHLGPMQPGPVLPSDSQAWLHAASSHAFYLLFITFPLAPLALIGLTSFMARHGLMLRPMPAAAHVQERAAAKPWETIGLFLAAPLAALVTPSHYFPYLMGLFALWMVVRLSRLNALALNAWLVVLACLLFLARPEARPMGMSLETARFDLALSLTLTSFAVLIAGATLDDLRREVRLRKAALRALRESQSRFKEITAHIDDVIFLIQSEDGAPIYLNPAAGKLLDEPLEALLGKPDWLLCKLAPGQEAIAEKLRRPGIWSGPLVQEMRLQLGDGRMLWVRLRINPADETRELPRVPGTLTDITEAKAAEAREANSRQQRQETEKLASLGLLVAGMAHEINNPNALILLGAEALHEGLTATAAPDRERLLPWVAAILEGSDRINRIVSGLKDFARVDTHPVREKFAVARLITSTLVLAGHLLREKTDRFSYEVAPGLPLISGHFQKLEQALIQLLHNACQALEHPQQAVEITVRPRGEGYLAITVRDEGRGIAPEDIPRVHEPFFTTQRDQGKTGLGLSVVFGIVQEHGGHMQIESALGKGTTVTLVLPTDSA